MGTEESPENTEYDFSLSTPAAWNDRPTLDDGLEWEDDIEALYEFITHEETNPPLSISIDGKWGVGKTSFMLQLEHKLRRDGHFTVNFNPWRHQDADPLWGAFMQSFLQQLLGSLSFRDRMRGRARLYIRGLRSDRSRFLRPLATLVVTIGVLVAVMLVGWRFGPDVAVSLLKMVGVSADPTGFSALAAMGIGSLMGGASWLAIVWQWSERRVVDPVHAELQRYLVLP